MALSLFVAAPAAAETLRADERFTQTRLVFSVNGSYTNYTLTVSGPQGFHAQAHGERSAPTLRLADYGEVPDGVYNYQLTAATDRFREQVSQASRMNNGRENTTMRPRVGASVSGAFHVRDGRIREFEDIEESQGL
ncbi:hypothetical protein DDZ18_03820 [Marinicauda salina]|uniref:Uncharacterized protein n=1 Tax=Marinicauda salina TaxID=2135793 RepID=A0A2U2BXK4_9PROT|nr:hypothetical protein DDZ18_03820 [Marinicauda salina]